MQIQVKLMYIPGELPETHHLYLENFNFKNELVTIPGQMSVCSRCQGLGTHSNPSIDGNGLSNDCLSDSDFMEDYMSGVYDILCEDCDGRNVVPTVNKKDFTSNDWAIYKQHQEFERQDWEMEQESRYERERGA